MRLHHVRTAFDKLYHDGPIEFCKKSKNFLLWNQILSKNSRFGLHTSKNKYINKLKFDAPADPYDTIEITPNNIEYGVTKVDNNEFVPIKKGGIGQVRGGDWDLPKFRVNLNEYPVTKGLIQRFEKEENWEETEYYQYLVKKFGGTNIHERNGFDSLEEYLNYRLQKYDDLYTQIKENGYQPGHEAPRKDPDTTQPIKDRLEVLVVIDRWGNINHWDGQHRLIIARNLDLTIPAHVACRHKKWQKFRDGVYNNGFLPEDCNDSMKDHPDLQDVIA